MFTFPQNISQNQQPKLFGSPADNNKNEEKKTKIRTSLFNNNNNEKNSLFGNLLDKAEKKEQQQILFGSNMKKNLFGAPLDKPAEKNTKEESKENKENLFSFDKKEKSEVENNIFKSPDDKKSINKNLFQNNSINTPIIKNNLFGENKESKEKEKKEEESKKIQKENIFLKTNNSLINSSNKKEESKTMGLFGAPNLTNSNPESKSPNNIISNTNSLSKTEVISTNRASNLSSSKRIEDDEQVQSALQNLYVSDILIKTPSSYGIPSLIKDKKLQQNYPMKKNKSKTIDFSFIVQIKDIPNINEDQCNMICKSDESMSKLLKKANLYVKKKYKMTNELNDFEILLKKNGCILPINDDKCIGDYIKNKDKIIIYLVHNSSNQEEENIKFYEIEDKKEKNIEIKLNENKVNDIKNDNIIPEEKADEDNINISQDNKENIKLFNTQIINNSDNLNLLPSEKKSVSYPTKNKKNKNEILCPTDKLPILKREGYFMLPDEYAISRMTLEEINNVENFCIFNDNGKIEFEGKVSLYGVNFDNLFNIEHELIEYEKGEWCHSPRGKNFNIPAKITFYNVQCNIDISNDNERKMFLDILETKCKKYLNAKFISYDFNNGTLIYKIPYFY